MELPILDLEPLTFQMFGRVIERPERLPDATGPGWLWWAENEYLSGTGKSYGIGYLELTPEVLQFDWAECHMQTDELIVPLDGECLVYVATSLDPNEPSKLPPPESFHVFRIRPGQAALLDKGVWHGAPLATVSPVKVLVLLLKDSGKSDLSLVRFPDHSVRIIGENA